MPIAPFINSLATTSYPGIISGGGGDSALYSFKEGAADLFLVEATGAQPITYSISGGADSALFSITDGLLSFLSPPEYSTPLDNDGNNCMKLKLQLQTAWAMMFK